MSQIFLHIHGLISTDHYSSFLVCEDSSNNKFLISHLFDVAEGSTLGEASNNCIHLEWNKGIVGHMAALGEPLNIKDAYEVSKLVDQRQGGTRGGSWRVLEHSPYPYEVSKLMEQRWRGARSVDGALGSRWES